MIDVPRGRTYLGRFRDFAPPHILERVTSAIKQMQAEHGSPKPEDLFINRMLDMHVIRIDVTTGTAGLAGIHDNTMHIHTRLTEADTVAWKAHRDGVILHEMAHMLDWWFFKNAGHGKTWRMCNAYLGQPYEPRCHQLDLPGTVKLRKIPNKFAHYECECGAKWKRKVNFNEYKGKSAARREPHADCPVNGIFQFTQQTTEDVPL